MPKKKQVIVWLAWLIVFPTTIIYLYSTLTPSYTGQWADLLSFAIIMCAVSYFPIRVGSITIFLANGISFAAFLYFGLFAEVILTQLALLALILRLRITRDETHRIATNSLMMLITSISSASVYYWLGGDHGVLALNTLGQIIPLVGYIFTGIIVNQLLIVVLDILLNDQRHVKIGKSFFADVLLTALVFPLGLVLYLLYIDLQIPAIYFVGIPFVLLSIAISLYYNGQQVNRNLRRTSEIGHELTKTLNVKSVLDTFVNTFITLIPTDYLYVYDISIKNQTMTLIRYAKDGETIKNKAEVLPVNEGIAGVIYREQKPILLNTKSQVTQSGQANVPDDVHSFIGVPIMRNDRVVGLLMAEHRRSRAYEAYHVMIIEILANFLSVAIENARHYELEKRKGEFDELTHLHNYRYLTEHIEQFAMDLKAKEIHDRLSIIIIDLDSFKSVNDTYGHEAGNEVLVELSNRLESFISDRGIVARYGGEEFTILVKGMTHEEVFNIAEEVRLLISEEPFSVHHQLDQGQQVDIHVTASLGVATYPDHCDSPEELLRQADRAMYVGAKNSGKNRVASI